MVVAQPTCTPGLLRLVSRHIDSSVRNILTQARDEVSRLASSETGN